MILIGTALKQNCEIIFSPKDKETLHTSLSISGTISSFLTNDVAVKECDALESIKTYAKVLVRKI